MSELARRRRLDPWKYAVPTRPQRTFFELENFIQVFSGGNRSGKTQGGAIKFLRTLYENPGSRGRVASDKELVTKVLIPALKDWIGDRIGEWDIKKGDRHYESQWRMPNGSFFDILTYDQKDISFAGTELQVAWFDEPPPETKFNETKARFSKGGFMMFTFTPLLEAAWVYDQIVCADPDDGMDVRIVYSDIEDNCIECAAERGEVGYLHHGDIERILAGYSPDELEARKSGRFLHLTGLIYKSFDWDVHVIDRFPVPKHWNIFQSVDPHDSRPFASAWFGVNEINDVYVIDEHPRDNFEDFSSNPYTLNQYLEIYKKKEQVEGWRVLRRTIDPNFGNVRSNRTGRSIRQEARERGFNFTEVDNDLNVGHAKVREYLQFDKAKPVDNLNKPKLYVFSDLRNVIHGFTHYMYDPKNGKPQEDFKDYMDAVRYFLMTRPRFSDTRSGRQDTQGWRKKVAEKAKKKRRRGIDI